jgi:D-alanyl-lipoteichoic acid acyltransferase DltB (MBOAT superfamily)
MLFNSIDFAIFLPIVFILYWFVFNKNLKYQNILIVVASYVFYGWWDWRFLSLILFSTLVDYSVGLALSKQSDKKKRRFLLWISIFVNLGFLGIFKYYNFFLDNFIETFRFFGHSINARGLDIVLPVGISFYTFQTMSYTIDIYKKKLEPTKDFIAFTAFVSFFPQLVAGPIERATHLLPQFFRKRNFNYEIAAGGVKLIIWGLFKKIVVADNSAFFVDKIFENYTSLSSFELLVGAVLFAFQIYGDFSGYSDIAIGTARLFGFSLMTNFKFPYFSRDIAEFWRRWHISLSTWFRDYVYFPLGGSKYGRSISLRNIIIVFIVSGFWHGANWTFIVWGALNAFYYIPLFLLNKNRINLENTGSFYAFAKELKKVLITFLLTCFAWVFFRSDSISDAYLYLLRLFGNFSFSIGTFTKSSKILLISFVSIISILVMISLELKSYINKKEEVTFGKFTFYILVMMIFFMGVYKDQMSFIYFQF